MVVGYCSSLGWSSCWPLSKLLFIAAASLAAFELVKMGESSALVFGVPIRLKSYLVSILGTATLV